MAIRFYDLATFLSFHRAMHYSAKCGIAIACRPSVSLLSVCDVGVSGANSWKFWKLIKWTISPTHSLFVAQSI